MLYKNLLNRHGRYDEMVAFFGQMLDAGQRGAHHFAASCLERFHGDPYTSVGIVLTKA